MRFHSAVLTPMRGLAALGILTLSLSGVTAAGASTAQAGSTAALPPIQHVWYIDLENEGSAQTFGDPAADPYLATTLTHDGCPGARTTSPSATTAWTTTSPRSAARLRISPPKTTAACGRLSSPPTTCSNRSTSTSGTGACTRRPSPTIGTQLSQAGLTWKAYLQDMGNDPARDLTVQTSQGPACGHPQVGQPDATEGAEPADQFADRHEGFMYFQSVTGNAAYCDAHVLSFQPLLKDLSLARTTPNFSFLAPNLCNDGHDAPCANGDPGGLINIDAFLSIWVPIIMASPAYKDGLIFITFDEGSTSTACCGETSGRTVSHPNSAEPGMNGPGGGRVGAVLISPFIKGGTVSTVDYNHYSALRSIEDLFGLSHLGDAQMPQVKPFGSDVYTNA